MTSGTIVSATTMDITEKIRITLPKSILQTIDQKRGDIARSRYIRKAIEGYLGNSSKNHNHRR
jgi:metal-responsive CopG/Arc/MetJ family transcriptional regulator